mmetsp:Transcript_23586/g.67582  ORF Transcript_23586/g.67582 Transcript_23586/m.67582 type:complete len:205 (-) Transcript_23586:500-1114(-)
MASHGFQLTLLPSWRKQMSTSADVGGETPSGKIRRSGRMALGGDVSKAIRAMSASTTLNTMSRRHNRSPKALASLTFWSLKCAMRTVFHKRLTTSGLGGMIVRSTSPVVTESPSCPAALLPSASSRPCADTWSKAVATKSKTLSSFGTKSLSAPRISAIIPAGARNNAACACGSDMITANLSTKASTRHACTLRIARPSSVPGT